MLDILIKNGHVMDPYTGVNGIADIGIRDGLIVDPGSFGEKEPVKHTIDASGCLVFPGLIDFHSHVFEPFTELGVIPDLSFLPQGVTATVDGGSSGAANFNAFKRSVVAANHIKMKAFINSVSAGMATLAYYENIDAARFNERKLATLFRDNPDFLLGLKVRIQKEMLGIYGIEALERTLEMAEHIGTRVCVHTTNPVVDAEKVVRMLRPGDIFCHVFHGSGSTMIDEQGKVKDAFYEAREKGIIFDAANGKMNWSFNVVEKALEQGFLPDIISTDLTTLSMYTHPVKGLPFVMSKYLNLGMSLWEILERVLVLPAKLMRMSGRIGTLAPGACGDVAIFRLEDRKCVFYDTFNRSMTGTKILVPQMTIIDGVVVYSQVYFEN